MAEVKRLLKFADAKTVKEVLDCTTEAKYVA
jgi:hypothetical protein